MSNDYLKFEFLGTTIKNFNENMNVSTCVIEKIITDFVTRHLGKNNLVPNLFKYESRLRKIEMINYEHANTENDNNKCTDIDFFNCIETAISKFWKELNNLHGPLPDTLTAALKVEKLMVVDYLQDPSFYFAPFLKNRLFLYSFIIKQFPQPRSLVHYWIVHPVKQQFFRDLGYFAALWFDPSIHLTFRADLHMSNIEKICATMEKIRKENTVQFKHNPSTTAMSEKSYNCDDDYGEDDDEDEDDDGTVDKNMIMNRFIFQDFYLFKKKNVYGHLAFQLVSLLTSFVPQQVQRNNRSCDLDVQKLGLMLAFMFEKNICQTLYTIIDSNYASLKSVMPHVDPNTLCGLFMYLQFFTKTHIDIIISETISFMKDQENEKTIELFEDIKL